MANRYFINVGTSWNSTANWSTSSGGAGGASIPTATDDVFFDANSGACNIDVNANCLSINSTGYASTLTQTGAFTLTIATGASTWAAGTFVGGSGAISTAGDFTQSGGTFTSTSGTWTHTGTNWTYSGGTFNHGSGRLKIGAKNAARTITGSVTLYDFEIDNSAYTQSIVNTITVNNDFIVTATNGLNTGTVDVKGNLTSNATTNNGTLTVLWSGGGSKTISSSGTARFPNLTINGAGTLTATCDMALKTGFTYTAGTWTPGTYAVIFNEASSATITGATSFYKLTLDKSAFVITFTSTVTVTNLFTLTAVNGFNGGTLNLQGNATFTDTSVSGTTAVTFSGTAAQNLDMNAGNGRMPDGLVTINKASNSVTLTNGKLNLSATGQDLVVASGSLVLGSYGMTIDDAVTVSGGTLQMGSGAVSIGGIFTMSSGNTTTTSDTWTQTGNLVISAGTLSASSGILKLNGIGKSISFTGTHTWNTVELDVAGSVTWTLTGNLDVDNLFYAVNRSGIYNINGGTVLIGGNAQIDQECAGSTTYKFDRNGSCGLTGMGKIGAVEIALGSGTWSLASGMYFIGGFTHISGGLDIAGTAVFAATQTITSNGQVWNGPVWFQCGVGSYTFTITGDMAISGTLSILDNAGSYTFNGSNLLCSGNVDNDQNDVQGSSTLVFNGTGAQALDDLSGTGALGKVQINKASGTLTITGGFNCRGDWTHTAGTVDATGSSLTFTVSLTINDSVTQFGNVAFVPGAAGTYTYTITGNMDVNGQLGFPAGPGSVLNLNGGNINLSGDLSTSETDNWGGTCTITFDGTGTQNVMTGGTGTVPNGNWIVNKASGSVVLTTGALALDGAGQALTITQGTFDLNGLNLTVAGALTITDKLKLKGNETITRGSLVNTAGTVVYYDPAVTALFNRLGTTFHNIEMLKGKTYNGTISTTIAVTGTVSFSSTGTITLRSSSAGTRFLFNFTGDQAWDADLDVKDCSALPGVGQTAYASTDSGNNVNWNFVSATARFCVGATWNNAANWSGFSGGSGGAGVPAGTNEAIFDANSPSCAIDTSASCQKLDSTGYTATLTQQSGHGMTIGVSGIVWAAGTFVGGDTIIANNGPFTLSGGSFTSTSDSLNQLGALTFTGGTWAHNNGELRVRTSGNIDANGETFYDVDVNSSFIQPVWTGTMKVAHEFRVTTASSIKSSGGKVECIGTCAAVSTAALGSGNTLVVEFSGSGAQTLGAGGGSGDFCLVNLNKSGGTLTVSDTLEIAGWTTTAGGATLTASGSTFNLIGNVTADATTVFGNVTIAPGGAFGITITGTMAVGGTLLISAVSTITGGTIDCRGNVTTSDSTVTGTCAITLTGTAAQSIDTTAGAGRFPNGTFTVNKASGTVTLTNGALVLDATGQDLVATSGTLDLSTYGMTIDDDVTVSGGTITGGSGTIDIDGDLIVSSGTFVGTSGTLELAGDLNTTGGTFTHNSGTVDFNSTAADQTVTGAPTLYDLDLTKGGYSFIVATTVTVANDFTITTLGGISTGTIDVKGNIISNDASITGTGVVQWSGSGSKTISSSVTAGLTSLTINGTGTLTLSNDLDIDRNFTLTAGTFAHGSKLVKFKGTSADSSISGTPVFYGVEIAKAGWNVILDNTVRVVNTYTLTTSGTHTGGTWQLEGDAVFTDASVGGTTAITFAGSVAQNLDMNGGAGRMPNGAITINKASGTVTLSNGALVLVGGGQNLTVTSGTLDLNGENLTVPGTFDVDGGLKLNGTETLTTGATTIDATSSTVTYYGAGTALLDSLTQTYYNLTLGAGKTHQVTAGVGNGIQVNGAFATGGAGAILRSTSDGTQWELDLQGTSSLGGNVDVKDSDATAGNQVSAIGSTDSGNNDNWLFVVPTTARGDFGAKHRFTFGLRNPFVGFGAST